MVKIIIYTKDNCPYCIRAKMLFNKYKVNFEEIDVTDPIKRAKLVEKTSWMTVPQIFIGEKFIGGCDDLYKLETEGKLKNMLNLT